MGSITERPSRDLARLLIAAVALVLLVGAADALWGSLIQRSAQWQAGGDPRERILWDRNMRDARVVLVGDSLFCSYYVDGPEQTLWTRLSEGLHVAVFPAGLSGATPADLLLVANRVVAHVRPGAVVLVDLHPIHVFSPGAIDTRESRYAAWFRELDDAGQTLPLPGDLRPASLLTERSFVLGNHERLHRYLSGTLQPASAYYKTRWHRDRRWDDDADGYARQRFENMQAAFSNGKRNPRLTSFDWVRRLDATFKRAGLQPVFVLTPLNQPMMALYAGGDRSFPAMLAASRAYLLEQLRASGITYVDLYSALGPDLFADLIHPNARGDDRMAAILAREIGPRIRAAESAR